MAVASSRIALDLPYWSMRSAWYHLIRMAIKLAREAGACFSVINFMSYFIVSKRPWYGPLTAKRALLQLGNFTNFCLFLAFDS